MLRINYKDPRPIYEQIKSELRRQIACGELAAGTKLPSVRELAISLTINPNTIQRAYRELETEGWIQSAAGKGSFAAEGRAADNALLPKLWAEFDEAARRILAAGIHPKDLCAHILNGGIQYDPNDQPEKEI